MTDRHNSVLATEALLIQQAINAALSTDGAKAFKVSIDNLTAED